MVPVYSWLGWVVGLAAGLGSGVLARRLGRAYEAALQAGAAADVVTLLSAVRAASSDRTWDRRDRAAAALMVGIMAACLAAQGQAAALASGLACVVLLWLACIDIYTGLLPDALTLPLLALGVWMGPAPADEALLAAAVAYLCARGLAQLYCVLRGQAGMGGGDFKLMAALAAWTGTVALVWIVLIACVGGLVFAMGAQRRLMPRGAYPFGPFLALAAAPVLVAGPGVQSWF